MTPIMFTLLFTFVFGGALAGSPRRLSTGVPARHPGADGGVQRGVLGHGPVDGSRQGAVRPLPQLPIWSLAPFAGLMVGDVLRHLIAGGIILTIGLILGYRPGGGHPRRARRVRDAGHHRLRHGLDLHRARPADPHADDGDDDRLHVHVPAGVRVQHHGGPGDDAGLAARVRRGESGVAHDHARCAGSWAATATFEQVALALIAPVVLTVLLAPVTIWLYRKQ